MVCNLARVGGCVSHGASSSSCSSASSSASNSSSSSSSYSDSLSELDSPGYLFGAAIFLFPFFFSFGVAFFFSVHCFADAAGALSSSCCRVPLIADVDFRAASGLASRLPSAPNLTFAQTRCGTQAHRQSRLVFLQRQQVCQSYV